MLTHLLETEKAYIAGIFDGEGCVGYYKRKGYRNKNSYVALVIISQSDVRLMHWLQAKIGFGTIVSRAGKKHFEYHWETNKKEDVCNFLRAIRPYLLMKGEQVDVLLEHFEKEASLPRCKGGIEITPEVLVTRDAVYRKLSELKVANLKPSESSTTRTENVNVG